MCEARTCRSAPCPGKRELSPLSLQNRPGFTLVEIMVVVIVVGILAVLAVSSFHQVRLRSQNTIILNAFRQFKGAFTMYEMENGFWPEDTNEGILPPEMEGYIPRHDFENTTPMGGNWDWECGVFGIAAGVSLRAARVDDEQMQMVDQSLDDGNLAQGSFRVVDSDAYTLVLMEE
ncbi:prepilin-type N-terminal cleavage/methylation domain-containing protein [Ruficoccus amylovorans]|uniref:Prepilin-type N-terminal cleavage/methylation domain-containing protein n=1 Tax=Ruficoccus amylovorans TaxID=1804625 RepID=A0A842HBW4_9BACT|nr:prepilin-type N-terminal cleavage/methylation domain-containing protein [Ruficoccus amylovorans]MBC2593659.1 prepilin-type N-terminal cleavage/methylation domain-containing protein [Ruficoccus amylovorans]